MNATSGASERSASASPRRPASAASNAVDASAAARHESEQAGVDLAGFQLSTRQQKTQRRRARKAKSLRLSRVPIHKISNKITKGNTAHDVDGPIPRLGLFLIWGHAEVANTKVKAVRSHVKKCIKELGIRRKDTKFSDDILNMFVRASVPQIPDNLETPMGKLDTPVEKYVMMVFAGALTKTAQDFVLDAIGSDFIDIDQDWLSLHAKKSGALENLTAEGVQAIVSNHLTSHGVAGGARVTEEFVDDSPTFIMSPSNWRVAEELAGISMEVNNESVIITVPSLKHRHGLAPPCRDCYHYHPKNQCVLHKKRCDQCGHVKSSTQDGDAICKNEHCPPESPPCVLCHVYGEKHFAMTHDVRETGKCPTLIRAQVLSLQGKPRFGIDRELSTPTDPQLLRRPRNHKFDLDRGERTLEYRAQTRDPIRTSQTLEHLGLGPGRGRGRGRGRGGGRGRGRGNARGNARGRGRGRGRGRDRDSDRGSDRGSGQVRGNSRGSGSSQGRDDRGGSSQGSDGISQGRSTNSQGRSTNSQGRSTNSQGRSTNSQGRSTNSQDRGGNSQDRDGNSQGRGGNSQGCGGSSQDRDGGHGGDVVDGADPVASHQHTLSNNTMMNAANDNQQDHDNPDNAIGAPIATNVRFKDRMVDLLQMLVSNDNHNTFSFAAMVSSLTELLDIAKAACHHEEQASVDVEEVDHHQDVVHQTMASVAIEEANHQDSNAVDQSSVEQYRVDPQFHDERRAAAAPEAEAAVPCLQLAAQFVEASRQAECMVPPTREEASVVTFEVGDNRDAEVTAAQVATMHSLEDDQMLQQQAAHFASVYQSSLQSSLQSRHKEDGDEAVQPAYPHQPEPSRRHHRRRRRRGNNDGRRRPVVARTTPAQERNVHFSDASVPPHPQHRNRTLPRHYPEDSAPAYSDDTDHVDTNHSDHPTRSYRDLRDERQYADDLAYGTTPVTSGRSSESETDSDGYRRNSPRRHGTMRYYDANRRISPRRHTGHNHYDDHRSYQWQDHRVQSRDYDSDMYDNHWDYTPRRHHARHDSEDNRRQYRHDHHRPSRSHHHHRMRHDVPNQRSRQHGRVAPRSANYNDHRTMDALVQVQNDILRLLREKAALEHSRQHRHHLHPTSRRSGVYW